MSGNQGDQLLDDVELYEGEYKDGKWSTTVNNQLKASLSFPLIQSQLILRFFKLQKLAPMATQLILVIKQNTVRC